MLHSDIAIIGSGIVGATTALALAKQNPHLQITLIDAKPISHQWQADAIDFRVSAISLASERIFRHLNCWKDIQAKRISPYQKMVVWDEMSSGDIQFDRAKLGVPALGYIIEDSVIRTSLIAQLAELNNLQMLDTMQLVALKKNVTDVDIIFADQSTHHTALLIGADGANSWVRDQLQISFKTWDYQQTAIVATVKTTETHQHTAWQRFLKTGPLAFLPLSDSHTCSIVWSAIHERAAELMQLSDEEFSIQLTEAFGFKLGNVVSVSKRYSFPLRMRHVKHYVAERIALVGDAAHTIHPLAGQGVNLGLLDAACLTEVITHAVKNKKEFASLPVLRRYERWRKADNFTMLASVDVLKNVFIQQSQPVRMMRGLGLTCVNRMELIKKLLAGYALGERGDLPPMALAGSPDAIRGFS